MRLGVKHYDDTDFKVAAFRTLHAARAMSSAHVDRLVAFANDPSKPLRDRNDMRIVLGELGKIANRPCNTFLSADFIEALTAACAAVELKP